MYFSNSIDEATQYDKQEDGDRMVSLLNKIRYMLRVKTEYRLKKV